jgi:IS5 family transposase
MPRLLRILAWTVGLTLCSNGGVTVVCIPQSGGKRAPEREACEKAPAFKHGQR